MTRKQLIKALEKLGYGEWKYYHIFDFLYANGNRIKDIESIYYDDGVKLVMFDCILDSGN